MGSCCSWGGHKCGIMCIDYILLLCLTSLEKFLGSCRRWGGNECGAMCINWCVAFGDGEVNIIDGYFLLCFFLKLFHWFMCGFFIVLFVY